MRSIFVVLQMILTYTAAHAQEVPVRPWPTTELTAELASGEFQLHIDRKNINADSQLIIKCIYHCNRTLFYKDNVSSGVSLGAYSIGDGFLTLWEIGDGMLVRVYHVSPDNISKVLEVPTRGQYPSIIDTQDGKRGIVVGSATAGEILEDDPVARNMKKVEIFGDIWDWDGYMFKKEK